MIPWGKTAACRHYTITMETNSYERYLNFTEEELICDPYFQDWVIHPDEENSRFWSGFLSGYPEKKAAVEKAVKMLKRVSFKAHMPDEALVQQSLAKHLEAIESLVPVSDAPLIPVTRKQGAVWQMAAVFGGAVLLTAALFYFNRGEKRIAVQTPYGNIRTLILQDSSRVVLNANSGIEYGASWKQDEKREVWLNGEAFFEVRHINRNEKAIRPNEQFLVHTRDLDITVLGTSFDIRERREKTEVVLETGTIKISFRDKARQDVLMKPGDLVTWISRENKLVRTTTIPENYTAWKERKLLLTNPTVKEIVAYLEDNYGKKIVLESPGLETRVIEGPILLSNLEDVLFILSTVLNTEVIRKDSTLILRPR